MMKTHDHSSLLWLYPGRIECAMDSATWLATSAELIRLGWQVTLLAAGKPGTRRVGPVDVTFVAMPRVYLLRQVVFHAGLYWYLLNSPGAPDVIMFEQMSAPWLLPVRLLRGLLQKKRPLLVIDIRSLHMPDAATQGIKGRLRGFFQQFSMREARRWVDGYLTITPMMAEEARVPGQMLLGVWPSGVELDVFRQAQSAHVWPASAEAVRLIYIGTLTAERNLLTLCRAVEQANAEGMTFELILVGSGDAQPALAQFAKSTNGRIQVLPAVPHASVPGLLAGAHIGVLPFPADVKFQVSSPIKLFEYMAAGMPLLATRITAHTSVVAGSEYVFWAESADAAGLVSALRLAWQQRGNLAHLGAQAAAAAGAFTWRQSAVKLSNGLKTGLARFSE